MGAKVYGAKVWQEEHFIPIPNVIDKTKLALDQT